MHVFNAFYVQFVPTKPHVVYANITVQLFISGTKGRRPTL